MSMEYPTVSFDAGAGVGTIGVPPMRESHAGSTVLGGGSGRGHSRDASSPMWGTSNPLASPPMGPVTMLPPVGAGVHRNPSASSQASVSSNSSSNRSHLVSLIMATDFVSENVMSTWREFYCKPEIRFTALTDVSG